MAIKIDELITRTCCNGEGNSFLKKKMEDRMIHDDESGRSFLVATYSEMCIYRKNIEKLHIAGMYDLSLLFPNQPYERLILYMFSKDKVDVDIVCYEGPENISTQMQNIYTKYNRLALAPIQRKYLERLELHINNGIKMNFEDCAENTLDHDDVSDLHPYFYRESYLKLEEFHHVSISIDAPYSYVHIEDIAKVYEISRSGSLDNSDSILRDGDIFIPFNRLDSLSYVNDVRQLNGKRLKGIVIRSDDHEQLQYLYLMMKSKVFFTINKLSTYQSEVVARQLAEFEIPIPSDRNEYRHFLSATREDDLESIFDAIVGGDAGNDLEFEPSCGRAIPEEMSPIVSELKLVVKNIKYRTAKKILESDIRELYSCYGVDAFKSVFALCGSILELLLLCELSRICRMNCFKFKDRSMELKINGSTRIINGIRDYVDITTKNGMYGDVKKEIEAVIEKRNYIHPRCCTASVLNKSVCDETLRLLQKIVNVEYMW